LFSPLDPDLGETDADERMPRGDTRHPCHQLRRWVPELEHEQLGVAELRGVNVEPDGDLLSSASVGPL
jgi:hypothetical protein